MALYIFSIPSPVCLKGQCHVQDVSQTTVVHYAWGPVLLSALLNNKDCAMFRMLARQLWFTTPGAQSSCQPSLNYKECAMFRMLVRQRLFIKPGAQSSCQPCSLRTVPCIQDVSQTTVVHYAWGPVLISALLT